MSDVVRAWLRSNNLVLCRHADGLWLEDDAQLPELIALIQDVLLLGEFDPEGTKDIPVEQLNALKEVCERGVV